MKCKNCGNRYSAAIFQGAPGGSSAPGVFFILGVVFLAVSLLLFLWDAPYVPWLSLGVAIFILIQVPIAWGDCRGNGGYAEHGGVDCPECKTTNTIYPWSL